MDPNAVKLYLNIGSNGGVNAAGLVGFLCEHGGITGEQVLRVHMRDKFSFVQVTKEAAEGLVEATNGKSIGEMTIKVEIAKSR